MNSNLKNKLVCQLNEEQLRQWAKNGGKLSSTAKNIKLIEDCFEDDDERKIMFMFGFLNVSDDESSDDDDSDDDDSDYDIYYRENVDVVVKNEECLNECCSDNTFYDAMANGHLDCLKKYIEEFFENNDQTWDFERYESVIQNGHLHILQYLHDEMKCRCFKREIEYAVEYGQLSILQFLLKKCKAPVTACNTAAKNGHLNCVVELFKNGYSWTKQDIVDAAQRNHLDCVQFMIENGRQHLDYGEIILNVLKSKNPESFNLFKYILDKKQKKKIDKSDSAFCIAAAKGGSVECLQYLHEQGFRWDEKTCSTAAAYNSLEALKYARKHGCPWNERACACAAMNGHLDCLKYLVENGCPINTSTYVNANEGGSVQCLEYLCEINYELCSLANFKNTLTDCLVENGKVYFKDVSNKPQSEMFVSAAADGNYIVLKFMIENNYPMSEEACRLAAKNKHFAILRYLHNSGCPWDSSLYIEIIKTHPRFEFEMFKYAYENGCPVDRKVFIAAENAKEENWFWGGDFLKYLKDKLTREQIQEFKQNNNDMCGVCKKNQINCKYQPCGHVYSCYDCAKMYLHSTKKFCECCKKQYLSIEFI